MIDPLLLALIAKAGIVAVGAVFVRTQLAIHRGFDLSLAVIALLAGEIFLAVSGKGPEFAFRGLGAVLSVGAGALVGGTWGWLLSRLLGGQTAAQARVLISSLGLATLASGLVGMLRGSGVMQLGELPAWGPLAGNFATIFLLVLLASVLTLIWIHSRSGLEARLLDQDRAFATELGCDGAAIALMAGLICGAAAAAAGAANASLVGSSTSSGMTLFLMAAAGALLFGRGGMTGAFAGGAVVAALHTGVTLAVEPVWADFILFGGLALLIVSRGMDRSADAVR